MILRYFLNILFLVIFLTSCEKREDKIVNEDARRLFNESAQMIADITTKVQNATDSSGIDSLNRIFEKRITEINFSVPSETDLKLTEEENDSIFKLMKELKKQMSEKLISFSVVADSV